MDYILVTNLQNYAFFCYHAHFIDIKTQKKATLTGCFFNIADALSVCCRFSRRIHDLKGGASSQLLFDIRDDTHSHVFIGFD